MEGANQAAARMRSARGLIEDFAVGTGQARKRPVAWRAPIRPGVPRWNRVAELRQDVVRAAHAFCFGQGSAHAIDGFAG